MKVFKITTPNQGFTGVRQGVKFVDGEGETTSFRAAVILVRNYIYNCKEVTDNIETVRVAIKENKNLDDLGAEIFSNAEKSEAPEGSGEGSKEPETPAAEEAQPEQAETPAAEEEKPKRNSRRNK